MVFRSNLRSINLLFQPVWLKRQFEYELLTTESRYADFKKLSFQVKSFHEFIRVSSTVQLSYRPRIPPLQTEKHQLCFTDDAIFKSSTYVTVNKNTFASPSLFEFQMKSALSSSLFSKQ